MAYWDPFSVVGDSITEAPQAEGGAQPAVVASNDGGKEWTSTRISKKDFDAVVDKMHQGLYQLPPWNKSPNTLPDLSWHTPGCKFEDWQHTKVKVEISQGIIYIVLNNAEDDNRLSDQVIAGLCDAILLLHSRTDIRMAVFMGEGKMFCGGMHPSGDSMNGFLMAGLPTKVGTARQELEERALASGHASGGRVDMARLLQAKMWHTLFRAPQFTVCLLNGSVVGDGLGFLAVCDTVVAAKHVYLHCGEVKRGLVNAVILPYIVSKLGMSNAKCMVCAAENVTAEKALRMGLVQEVADDLEAGHDKVAELAQVLTGCGPGSVKTAKRLISGVAGRAITEGVMFFTGAMIATVTVSEEAKTGMVAVQARTLKPWEETPIQPLYGKPPDKGKA